MNFNILSAVAANNSGSSVFLGAWLIVLILFSVYFLPSIVALAKRNNRTKVILFNIFLGWTIVMWIISLVWACKRHEETLSLPSDTTPADELKKYKDLLDAGAITEDEFNEKKNQLLGI